MSVSNPKRAPQRRYSAPLRNSPYKSSSQPFAFVCRQGALALGMFGPHGYHVSFSATHCLRCTRGRLNRHTSNSVWLNSSFKRHAACRWFLLFLLCVTKDQQSQRDMRRKHNFSLGAKATQIAFLLLGGGLCVVENRNRKVHLPKRTQNCLKLYRHSSIRIHPFSHRPQRRGQYDDDVKPDY